MDLLIILSSCISFIIFLILQTVIFRMIQNEKLFDWIVKLFISGSLINFLLSLTIYTFYLPNSLVDFLIFAVISFFIYSSLVFFFLGAIFGIAVTSVRVQLLNFINNAGTKGLSYHEIIKKYNKETIVKTRLQRLIGSNEITYNQRDKMYQASKKTSVLRLYTYLFTVLNKIYMR